MNNIIWKRVKPLMQLDSINKFEQEYEVTLPDNLKEFIIANNGGRPNLDIIKKLDGNEVEVNALLSFNKEDVENIYKVIDYFKGQFGGKIVPIATEPSGDYFCINLNNNSIVYWEHETNELSFIANNLDEFLNCLYDL